MPQPLSICRAFETCTRAARVGKITGKNAIWRAPVGAR
jgi:hypothetical protein